MRLSAEQLGAFHEQGYLVVRQLADPATLRHLAAEVDGLHERMAQHPPPEVGLSWEEGLPQDQPPRIRQLMNSERVSPTIDRILTSERMLDIVAELIGPRIILFHSKLMMKSARDGSFTPWHQDWSYWKGACREPVQVNCMLSLDAAAVDNGCIRFVPGSHRQGELPAGDPHGELPGQVVLAPRAGTLLLLHGHCYHKVLRVTERPRISVNLRALAPGTPRSITDLGVYRNMVYRFSTREVVRQRC